MNVNKKPEWVGKARGPIYYYYQLATVAFSYATEVKKLFGFSFDYKVEDGDVYYNENNIRQVVEWLEQDESRVEQLLSFCKEHMQLLLDASEKYGKESTKEAFDKWHKVFVEFLPCFGLVLPLEDFLSKKIVSFLSPDDFLKVNYCRETGTIEERLSLLKCAMLKGAHFEASLGQHCEKYAWLGNKALMYSPYSFQQFRERASAIKNPKEELEKLLVERKQLLKQSDEVTQKLNPDQRKLVEQFQELLYLRTTRAEATCKAGSLTYPLFLSVAKQLNLSRDQLLMLSKEEIDVVFEGKPLPADFSKRSFNYSCEIFNGKWTVDWNPLRQKVENFTGEVKGTVAFQGIVRGKVRKVFEPSDVAKFEKGEILLATYTNPNLLPAMEKAAAIVTDFGGMTSHAAIVAREFGIPCVIGTGNATKVFQNGDEVEVDAISGIVRKIA